MNEKLLIQLNANICMLIDAVQATNKLLEKNKDVNVMGRCAQCNAIVKKKNQLLSDRMYYECPDCGLLSTEKDFANTLVQDSKWQ